MMTFECLSRSIVTEKAEFASGSDKATAKSTVKGEPCPFAADFTMSRFKPRLFTQASVAAGVAH